ncbi:MAG: hypothetical protein KatS3mg050_0389 [Litorilinea sp.]|nr:MAG: hypothetical protein KatS3mg050_0389 [Litorilinea sp.]
MELHEYPRPANDTGIGIHWCPGYATAIGLGRIRDFWIPEMKAMGIKWVKIFNHDGAIDFAELLLAEGFMPIVRLYRPTPNPGVLDIKEIVHLDAFIRAGVRYFEFNSEPDQDAQWKGGRVPANGLELVVENTIANLETILERGGMPGIPAVSNGSRWDLVGKIVARGRKDLFNGPVWLAIHNYSRNRPLDYPYDIGNQEGAAYTRRFYETVANEQWGEDAWRGRTLAEVNRLRLERCNPGSTVMDDPACWLAYEYFDARVRRHLGRSIPILSTENGYLVGEDVDPRYPATTPDLHMAQTLEACRIMMGTSQRFPAAPDYYFCTAFWLIGNGVLGSTSPWWEHHAWYSDRWPGGVLPIVRALKAEPKAVRRWQRSGPVGARVTLHGMVAHAGEHRTLILEKAGTQVARVTLDANSRYVIPDLLPGNYTLRVADTLVEQAVSLAPGQAEAVVNLDLAQPRSSGDGGSVLQGVVRGGAGAVVLLLRTDDGEEWVTMARDDGTFRFVDLPAGTYNLRLQQDGSRVDGLILDGRSQVEAQLAVAGWGYTVDTSQEADRLGLIRCAVEGHPGVTVQAHRDGWSSPPVQTGSMPELGEDVCEIGGLEAGHYTVTVTGLPAQEGQPTTLEAYVHVDKKRIPFIRFVYTDLTTNEARSSAIHGRVIGGPAQATGLQVVLMDQQARRHVQDVGVDRTFSFTGLGPGLYSVAVVGHEQEASQADIGLDGLNQVQVELSLPLEPGNRPLDSLEPVEEAIPQEPEMGHSLVVGTAPDAAGRMARLVDTVGNEYKCVVDAEDRFYFAGLPAGSYTLSIEGGYQQADLELDGSEQGLEVIFAPLVTTWESKVSPAGSMPGYSVLRVEVEGMADLPVYIWKPDWDGMVRRTGSKPEYGDHVAEFSPLGPGHYMIEPEGLGVWADVELTGLEVVWVEFFRKAVPSEPTVVRPVSAAVLNGTPGATAAGDALGEGPDTMENSPSAPEDGPSALIGQEDYLFLGQVTLGPDDVKALLDFVASARPAMGDDVAAAARARSVWVLGQAPDEALASWHARGVAVEFLQPPLAEALAAARRQRPAPLANRR